MKKVKDTEAVAEVKTETVQQIKKATYNKSGVTVEYTEALIVAGKGAIKTHAQNDPTPPHEDLIMSLKILLPHFIKMSPLALLFPTIDEKYIKGRNILDAVPEDPINMFEVNGITFSGVQDTADYTVQLIGRLKYPNGKVISMTLPGERLKAEGGYALKEQLVEDINNYVDEIDKFMNEGKTSAPSLFDQPAEASNGNDER